MSDEPNGGHWTLDRRIPVALLATLLGQLLAGIVFATLMVADVRDHARRLDRLETKDRADDARTGDLTLAIARLQEATLTLREAVAELKSAGRVGGPR